MVDEIQVVQWCFPHPYVFCAFPQMDWGVGPSHAHQVIPLSQDPLNDLSPRDPDTQPRPLAMVAAELARTLAQGLGDVLVVDPHTSGLDHFKSPGPGQLFRLRCNERQFAKYW